MTIRRYVLSMVLCVSVCSDLAMHRRVQHDRPESSRGYSHGTGRQPIIVMLVQPRIRQRNGRTNQRYARQSSVGRPRRLLSRVTAGKRSWPSAVVRNLECWDS